jgi:hypothetical protein
MEMMMNQMKLRQRPGVARRKRVIAKDVLLHTAPMIDTVAQTLDMKPRGTKFCGGTNMTCWPKPRCMDIETRIAFVVTAI